jgi:hypothetical protein
MPTTSLDTMWWDNAVIYQAYVRSFQDSDGDGVGDLPGVTSRLEHIAGLGADAVWLSPIYPSPNADYGYDVSDFMAVEPTFGTIEDFAGLVAKAHRLGLKVVLDFVPCHTSTQHAWFREHPEYYVWSETVANNWRAAFGGSAWGLDPETGRYFLHSFFPEQADLDWHRPEVRAAMGSAMQFWTERGVDGFRLDALDRLMKDAQLRDDPPATSPPPLPMDPDDALLDHVHSRNDPEVPVALHAIRQAVPNEFLVGEVFLPIAEKGPFSETLDATFSFEAMFAAADPAELRSAISNGIEAGHTGWVLSNHDFSRFVTRAGPQNARGELPARPHRRRHRQAANRRPPYPRLAAQPPQHRTRRRTRRRDRRAASRGLRGRRAGSGQVPRNHVQDQDRRARVDGLGVLRVLQRRVGKSVLPRARGAGQRRRRSRPAQPRGQPDRARLEAASQVRKGQETELWFNSEHLHLFDPENGQSLLGHAK